MKILFVVPGLSPNFTGKFYEFSEKWQSWKYLRRDLKKHERYAKRVFYGLGILTIASLLDPKEYTIEFIDENFEQIDFTKEYDLICLTGMIIHSTRVKELIQIFTQKGNHIVLGGFQATLYPGEFLGENISLIDGEAESLFLEFLDDFKNNKPRPHYRKSSLTEGKNIHSPVPRYELIAKYNYNLIGVQTTRGCPYQCEYCNVTNILGSNYRHKPVEQVLEEIRLVRKYWPKNMFYFYDDGSLADRQYVKQIFEKLDKGSLGLYGNHADISIYQDKEMLDLLVRAGDPVLAIGFETLSEDNAQYVTNSMKINSIPKYQEAVETIQNQGIKVTGSFMYGFNHDKKETLKQMMDFGKRNNLRAYFTIYSATPRSGLFDKLVSQYEEEVGPLTETGYARARIINDFFNTKKNINKEQAKEDILSLLKETYPDQLPIWSLEGLIVSLAYQNPAIL